MINNKKSKILIGCLTLLLAFSVGYALFSQNITINGTATAKGDFNIGVACQFGIDSSFATLEDFKAGSPDDYYPNEGGYKNDNCTVLDNTLTFSTELEYPGAARYFTAKITNNGTIDALFDYNNGMEEKYLVYIDENQNGTFEDSEIYDSTNPKHHEGSTGLIMHGNNLIEYRDIYGFEKADGTKLGWLTDEDITLVEQEFVSGDYYLLKPGNSIYILFQISAPNPTMPYGGKFFLKTESTYKFNFVQRTNN